MALDKNYAMPTCVAISSILSSKKSTTDYIFYLLVPEKFDKKTLAHFDILSKKYPNTTIKWIFIDDSYIKLFNDAPSTPDHVSKVAYFRLLLTKILPHHEKCIYLDSDIIVCEDLSDLINFDIGDNYLAGVQSAIFATNLANPDNEHAKLYCNQVGLKSFDNYLNAGVLLMNLATIRRDKIDEKFFKLLNRDLLCADQDVLNIACYERIVFLPLKYNYQAARFADPAVTSVVVDFVFPSQEVTEAHERPVIIHYLEKVKPWQSSTGEMFEIWQKVALESPYADEVQSVEVSIRNGDKTSQHFNELSNEKSERGFIRTTNKIKKNKHIFLLLAVIIVLTAYMVYWGTQKNGFHIDEMFTFMQINSDGQTRPYRQSDFYNEWLTSQELLSHITISKEDAFTYRGLAANSVHPQLYFYAMHTIYSFFPDTFTIWPAIALNILLYIGILILLYKFGLMLIDNKYLALLPCIVWGVSSAAIDIVVFIRMYMMLTFFCVLFAYLICRLLSRGWENKYFVFLQLSAFLGVITHYYFVVFAFFIFIFFCTLLIIKKQFMLLFKTTLPLFASVVLFLLFSRNTISLILSTQHGTGAIEGLFGNSGNGLLGVNTYLNMILDKVFSGMGLITVVIVCIVSIFTILLNRCKSIKITRLLHNNTFIICILIGLSTLCGFLMISQIATWLDYRYIANYTPFVSLLFVILLIYALRSIGIKSKLAMYIIIAVPLVTLLISNICLLYLHSDDKYTDYKLSVYHDLPVVIVNKENGDIAAIYWHLLEFDTIYITPVDNIDFYGIINRSYENGFILILGTRYGNMSIEEFMQISDFQFVEFIYALRRYNVFLVR
jgi:lipopolysaccharide biosynthesis glycosyltransferase